MIAKEQSPNIYQSYMQNDDSVRFAKSNPPFPLRNKGQLEWSGKVMARMGRDNRGVEDGASLQRARLVGAASVLGSADRRLIHFTTGTGGEGLIQITRAALRGNVALIRDEQRDTYCATTRPFVRIDNHALIICYQSSLKEDAATLFRKGSLYYDELRVGAYTCVVDPPNAKLENEQYTSPSRISHIQVLSEVPDSWRERPVYSHGRKPEMIAEAASLFGVEHTAEHIVRGGISD